MTQRNGRFSSILRSRAAPEGLLRTAKDEMLDAIARFTSHEITLLYLVLLCSYALMSCALVLLCSYALFIFVIENPAYIV